MDVSHLRHLQQIEDENRRLKHLVADLSLDHAALKDVLTKKMVRLVARRNVVAYRMQQHFSQRRACRLTNMHLSTARYRSRRRDSEALRQRLRELAHQRPRFGYRCLGVLLHNSRRNGSVSQSYCTDGRGRSEL